MKRLELKRPDSFQIWLVLACHAVLEDCTAQALNLPMQWATFRAVIVGTESSHLSAPQAHLGC
jgi:hypothetical protein